MHHQRKGDDLLLSTPNTQCPWTTYEVDNSLHSGGVHAAVCYAHLNQVVSTFCGLLCVTRADPKHDSCTIFVLVGDFWIVFGQFYYIDAAMIIQVSIDKAQRRCVPGNLDDVGRYTNCSYFAILPSSPAFPTFHRLSIHSIPIERLCGDHIDTVTIQTRAEHGYG